MNSIKTQQGGISERALSIDELNQLKGGYDKLVEQNRDLQTELNKYKQDYEEVCAGVLMLAQILNLTIPKKFDHSDLISEIAVNIENMQGYTAESGAE